MVSISDLTFSYSNSSATHVVFSSFNLTIPNGQICTILGSSGCGKSTLVNLIAGYLPISKGKILINGKGNMKPNKQRIIINQENDIFPWMTIYQNLKLIENDDIQVKNILEKLDLIQSMNNYPYQLSGGMKKKVSFARAVLADTRLIILDEPFSHLDKINKENIYIEFKSIMEKTKQTVLLVTHDIDEAIALSERIVVLSHNNPTYVVKDISLTNGMNLSNPQEHEKLKSELKESYKL